jgi:hypothetical protein
MLSKHTCPAKWEWLARRIIQIIFPWRGSIYSSRLPFLPISPPPFSEQLWLKLLCIYLSPITLWKAISLWRFCLKVHVGSKKSNLKGRNSGPVHTHKWQMARASVLWAAAFVRLTCIIPRTVHKGGVWGCCYFISGMRTVAFKRLTGHAWGRREDPLRKPVPKTPL